MRIEMMALGLILISVVLVVISLPLGLGFIGIVLAYNFVLTIREALESDNPNRSQGGDPVLISEFIERHREELSEEDQQNNLKNVIQQRRCCKLNGRNGDKFCDICGRSIPEEYIVTT